MADHCNICDTRRPSGGTNHLVLNNGELWIEYCKDCGEKETLTNEKGETKTLDEIAESCSDPEDPIYIRTIPGITQKSWDSIKSWNSIMRNMQ